MAFIDLITKNHEYLRSVVKMAWILQIINYCRLFWLWFGAFSYEYQEGKSRIF
ncbi:hypothetical protein RND81_04G125800 [Saponaria officinalis]|uniref:Uncharacterized protein n=1 Tax=Saponaria officinalis TaxID=3572 RepID=A0AAW1LH30_SAPOF